MRQADEGIAVVGAEADGFIPGFADEGFDLRDAHPVERRWTRILGGERVHRAAVGRVTWKCDPTPYAVRS